MSTSLLVSVGPENGRRFLLTEEEFHIGRDVTNDMSISDIEVSRQHCRIVHEAGQFVLVDLKSSNGTYVNDARTGRHELMSGDSIRIGSTELVFQRSSDQIQSDEDIDELSFLDRETAVLTGVGIDRIGQTQSRLDQQSTYYDLVTDEGETSQRFIQVGNDLRFLYNASLVTRLNTDTQTMFDEILKLIFDWIKADRCGVFLKRPNKDTFHLKTFKCRDGLNEGADLRVSQSVIKYVRKTKVGVLSSQAASDERWGSQASILKLNIDEVMCVPIQGRDDILGLIYLDTIVGLENGSGNRFNEDQLRLLIALAHQVAVAMENATFYQQLLKKERLAAIGETTSAIAHNVKNTLQGINGGSHLVASGLKTENLELIRKGWNIVSRNQEQISRLMIDMLIIGRPYEPMLALGNINEAIKEAISKIRFQLEHGNIQCQFEEVPTIEPLRFDINGITSAVLHLIHCSWIACSDVEQGKVAVFVREGEKSIRIVVTDNGKPVEIETEESGQAIAHLHGISLAVSRAIAEGHGGSVSVHHLRPTGNRFEMDIPLSR